MAESTPAEHKRGITDRFLTTVERLGNKLPEPFTLFTLLFVITAVVTTVMAYMNVTVDVPGADETVEIRGLFTGEGMTWLTENLGENYIGFPPIVTVVPILLAIGIAQRAGFLSAIIRKVVGSSPGWLLPYAVGFMGVAGSIMADAAFVVLPPLAALAFKAAGRHPVAGLIGAFAAVAAGYSTNFVPTSLDALFAGITNSVIPTVPMVEELADPVNPVSNYWFNIVSAFVLAILAGFIIDRIIEPRLTRQNVPREEIAEDDDGEPQHSQEGGSDNSSGSAETISTTLEPEESRGIVRASLIMAVLAVVMVVAFTVPMSPWRNEDGDFLPESPLLGSIVFIVFTFFAVGGYVYGRVARTISGFKDVPALMGGAVKDMAPFLVLAFILGQFIALFNWSGIGSWIAVRGADVLVAADLTGFQAILLFIFFAAILNLFITSGSAQWTLMAGVFVPMFGIIGFEPAFIQAAFRIGDSSTMVLTPLNPYMIILLTLLRKYEPEAGLGTIMARMIPFVLIFPVAWTIILFIFFQFDLDLGPGNSIYIEGM